MRSAYKKSCTSILCILFIMVIGLSTFGIINIMTDRALNDAYLQLNDANATLAATQDELVLMQNELAATQESLNAEIGKTAELEQSLEVSKQNLADATAKLEHIVQSNKTYKGWPMCWRTVQLDQKEVDFFAKLLYCEAGGMGYDGQFWVASAILNLSKLKGMSIWDMGHKVNIFAVAPWVDNAKPTQTQYDIINEVLSNGWIADVSYFRTNYYHSFGTPMTQIENVCFSKP